MTESDLHMVVIFLRDGWIARIRGHDPSGEALESSDVVHIPRNPRQSSSCSTAVVLGIGETEEDAAENAKRYWQRLCKWDGQEDTIFGHPVAEVREMSQVDIFSEETPSNSDSMGSVNAVSQRMTRSKFGGKKWE